MTEKIDEKVEFVTEKTQRYFLAYCNSEDVHGRTKTEYWKIIRQLCRSLEKDYLEMTRADALRYQRMMESRIADGKLSSKTLRLRLYCVSSFSAYLHRTNVLSKNPFLYLEKPVVADVPYTSMIPQTSDCEKLLAAAERSGMEMYVIFCCVLRMALTVSDVCNLKTADVITFDGKLVFYFPKPDAIEGQHYMVVPTDLEGIINKYRARVSTEYFFPNRQGKKLQVAALEKRVRKIVADAGTKRFALKDLRNRAIYQMIHDGATVEQVAKYCDLSMQRVNTFADAPFAQSEMLSICPANLSRLKVVSD